MFGQEEAAAKLLENISDYLFNHDRKREDEMACAKVYLFRRKVLGEEHIDTLNSKLNLYLVYGNLGKVTERQRLSMDVVESMSRQLGREYPPTLNAMQDLVIAYTALEDYSKAE